MNERKLLYIADPMCSWCWGFSPVIKEIAERVQGHADFSIIMGGLRFDTEPMTEQRRQAIHGHWTNVNKATGQPFKFDLLESDSFIYNTEPACRAVVAVRSLQDDHSALEMFDRLQAAFYAENLDITNVENSTQIAGAIGVDEVEFFTTMASPQQKQATQADFELSRQMGISGYPSVVMLEGKHAALLTSGYQPFTNLQGPILRWLDEGLESLLHGVGSE